MYSLLFSHMFFRRFARLISEHALRQADFDLVISSPRLLLNAGHFSMFKNLLDNLDKTVQERQLLRGTGGSASLSECLSSPTFSVPSIHAAFPLFGRFRNDLVTDLDDLAGSNIKAPLVIPVVLSSVGSKVKSLHDVCTALRRAHEVCTLLANQEGMMKHTYSLRFKLIQHLILEVSYFMWVLFR